jgi:CheY-like chemotaxis protein
MKNPKILLVEDTIINQIVVDKSLSKQNIGVTIANNGKEALELIITKEFDLVLMDINMPEMDGYESTRKIRSMDDLYFKTVPIILFSASAMMDESEKEKAMAMGITDFVSKPFGADELNSIINTYIMNKKSENRPLNINFELYTENDSEFKKELIELMINDLKELQFSLNLATTSHNLEIYRSTCHKIVGTLTMLNDNEFSDVTEVLKTQDSGGDKIIIFNKLTADIINSLKHEGEMSSVTEN